MPKKFKGENSKASAARERKSAAREAEESVRRKREEDEYWRDDDKHVAKKQERKADKERKRQDQLERKQAAKKLLEEEESKLKGKSSGAGAAVAKVTRAQIREAEEHRRSEGACAISKQVSSEPELEANPNHLLREQQEQGEEAARTVDEAIDLLRLSSQEKVDMHPEKRLKAAYAAFEERELPRLKAENPNLRLSQVKQLLRKEWMKSPDNPMNQL